MIAYHCMIKDNTLNDFSKRFFQSALNIVAINFHSNVLITEWKKRNLPQTSNLQIPISLQYDGVYF